MSFEASSDRTEVTSHVTRFQRRLPTTTQGLRRWKAVYVEFEDDDDRRRRRSV